MNNIEVILKLYKSFLKELHKYLIVLRNNDYEKLDYLICEYRNNLYNYIYTLECEIEEKEEKKGEKKNYA